MQPDDRRPRILSFGQRFHCTLSYNYRRNQDHATRSPQELLTKLAIADTRWLVNTVYSLATFSASWPLLDRRQRLLGLRLRGGSLPHLGDRAHSIPLDTRSCARGVRHGAEVSRQSSVPSVKCRVSQVSRQSIKYHAIRVSRHLSVTSVNSGISPSVGISRTKTAGTRNL